MMFTTIRNISVILLAISLTACGGGKKKEYLEPYQLSAEQSGHEGNAVKVAFLLPLSGKYAQLGKAMQDAAQLALFDANVPNLELVPLDTESASAPASKVAQDAIDGGAKLILGPVFSATTENVLPVAQKRQVNVISLSNDHKLAGKNGLFLLGIDPGQQVERVTQYAADRGIKEYAALVPSNAYGTIATDAYQKTVKSNHGTLTGIQYYGVSDPNVVKQQVEALMASLPAKDDMSAMLVPEGGDGLKHIATWASAAKNGRQLQWLGSSQWNDAALLSTPELQGGWFADTDPARHEAFNRRFNEAYGYQPPRIVSLAYDAVTLAANLAAQGNYDKEALTSPRGFIGVDSIFRFLDDGGSEHGLAVLQVSGGAVQVVDPAPIKFVKF